MAAIRERDKTGEGDHIDVSLFDVGISWMSYWIANYDTTGEVPERNGELGIGSAPNGLFEAADGYVYLITMTQTMFERLCEAVDRSDLLDRAEYQTMDDRIEHRPKLREELHEAFASYTAEELEQLLLEARVPAAAVRSIDEVVELPHLEARSMLTESYNPEVGEPVDIAALRSRSSPTANGPDTAVHRRRRGSTRRKCSRSSRIPTNGSKPSETTASSSKLRREFDHEATSPVRSPSAATLCRRHRRGEPIRCHRRAVSEVFVGFPPVAPRSEPVVTQFYALVCEIVPRWHRSNLSSRDNR